jgi:hypothetical protein
MSLMKDITIRNSLSTARFTVMSRSRARCASEYSDAERNAVSSAHPRGNRFKEDIIQAFYDGIKRKPDTTFGNVKADVLADKNPTFERDNFCSVIRGSAWSA